MHKPLKQENLDISSGILTPYYDFDTKVLFIAGKVAADTILKWL